MLFGVVAWIDMETTVALVLLVGFGLIFGSFVNALVWRLRRQDELHDKLAEIKAEPYLKANIKNQRRRIQKVEQQLHEASMVHGRSMCSKCQHPLAVADLIPFFSWLFLRGKCRYCRQPIEDSGLIDLAVPLLFVVSYLAWPWPMHGYGLLSFSFWLVFIVGFVALSLYDSRWFLLPDKIVWPLVALAIVQVALHATVFDGGLDTLIAAAWGVAIDCGVFLAIYLLAERFKKEWIGFGDVKLGIALGLLVGGPLEAALLLYIASLTGLLASIPAMMRGKGRNTLIPFGPFLMLACVCIVLAGPALTDWIKRLIMWQ